MDVRFDVVKAGARTVTVATVIQPARQDKIGVSICMPQDEFDPQVGQVKALANALQHETREIRKAVLQNLGDLQNMRGKGKPAMAVPLHGEAYDFAIYTDLPWTEVYKLPGIVFTAETKSQIKVKLDKRYSIAEIMLEVARLENEFFSLD